MSDKYRKMAERLAYILSLDKLGNLEGRTILIQDEFKKVAIEAYEKCAKICENYEDSSFIPVNLAQEIRAKKEEI